VFNSKFHVPIRNEHNCLGKKFSLGALFRLIKKSFLLPVYKHKTGESEPKGLEASGTSFSSLSKISRLVGCLYAKNVIIVFVSPRCLS
jgi:hypothetical protein